MNARLVVERGGKRQVLKLTPPVAVLGRARGNSVRIPSEAVSRRHCRLYLEDGLVTVEDLGSVNGTFLNGRRIQKNEVVRPGDMLEVGPVTFSVEYEMAPEARDRLRRQEEPVDVLDALADGELAELDEVQPADDLPVLEEVEDFAGAVESALASQGEPIPDTAADELAPADFSFDGTSWKIPDRGDLRDILSEIEDDEPPTRQQKPRR
jgi:pSer/pThr/pTyr-binding forkhead associated (FHA) protein